MQIELIELCDGLECAIREGEGLAFLLGYLLGDDGLLPEGTLTDLEFVSAVRRAAIQQASDAQGTSQGRALRRAKQGRALRRAKQGRAASNPSQRVRMRRALSRRALSQGRALRRAGRSPRTHAGQKGSGQWSKLQGRAPSRAVSRQTKFAPLNFSAKDTASVVC